MKMKVEVSYINDHARDVMTTFTSFVDVKDYIHVLSVLRHNMSMSETIVGNRSTTDDDRKVFANAFVPVIGKAASQLLLNETRAFWRGSDVKLTKAQLAIVKLLATNPDEYLSYRTIYDVVQKPGFLAGQNGQGHAMNVRSMIKRVRAKFHIIDPAFDAIETRFRFGYRWRA